MLFRSLFEQKFEEAIEELEKAVTLSVGAITWMVGSLGHAHAVAGNRTEALRIARELLEKSERELIECSALALIYVGLGEIENALNWMEKACDARGLLAVWGNVDPRFDPLRGEPRFQAVIRRMNLNPDSLLPR